MRLALLCILGWLPVVATAQQQGVAKANVSAFQRVSWHMCGRCGQESSHCQCDRSAPPCDVPIRPCEPTTPREGPPVEEQPPAEYVTRETGFFQAPPQTGSFQGPSRSWGISGGAIVFPEWRLRLPYVELPALSRTRESARMRMHAAEAPWISTGFETVRMGPAVAAAPAAPTGRAAPTPPSTEDVTPRGADEDCEALRRRYEQQIQQLERQLEQCEQLTRALQQQTRQPPPVAVEDDPPRPSPQQGSPIQAPVPEVDMGRLPPVPPTPADILHRAESWATPANYLAPSNPPPALEIPRRLPPAR